MKCRPPYNRIAPSMKKYPPYSAREERAPRQKGRPHELKQFESRDDRHGSNCSFVSNTATVGLCKGTFRNQCCLENFTIYLCVLSNK